MENAKPHQKKIVIDILARSFASNQSVNYIIKQDPYKTARIRALMDYSFEMCRLFGEVFISEEETACALLIYPDKKRTNVQSLLLDAKLIFRSVGIKNIRKTIARETLINSVHPKGLKTYLWFIGVDPKMQNKGHGSRLLQSIIQFSSEQNREICLETSTIQNLPWYKKYGFAIYSEQHLGYPLYFLRRS